MKPKSSNSILALCRVFAAQAIVISYLGTAHAANENRYWDGGTTNIATTGDGASLGTTGNWDTTLTNWDQGSGLAHVAWVNGNNDFANFGGTAGTVTLTSAVSANKLTFGTTGYIVAGNTLTLAGPAPEIATGSGISASISSILAGTTGLNKSGAGTLTITNTTAANSFTGGTTINGGTLALGTGGTGANTARVDALGTGTVTVNSTGTLKLWIQNSTAFTITNNLTVNGGTIRNEDGNHTLSGTFGIGASGATLQAVYSGKNLTLSGVVSGSGPMTVAGGGGAVILSGTNTYTGAIGVSSGTLQIASAANLGTSAASLSFPAAGAGLTITGTAVTLPNNISLGAVSGNINLDTPSSSSTIFNGVVSGGGASTVWFLRGGASGANSGAITLNGTNTGLQGTLNVQRGPLILGNANAAGSTSIKLDSNNNPNGALQLAGNFTISNNVSSTFGSSQRIGVGTGISAGISGVISSAAGVGIEKVGAGTLSLSAANTYDGGTIITAGTLKLDYTTNNGSKLADAAALTFAGGTLDLAGSNVTPQVEMIGSTTVSANSSLTRSGATANQIALGTVSSTGGILDIAANSLATTTNTLANGLLPSYITVGGAPATTNGSNEIIAASGMVDVNRLGGLITNSAGTNVRIIEGGAGVNVGMFASGTTDIATLTNAGTAGPSVVDIGAGNTLRLAASGALAAGANGLTISSGTLTAGGATDTSGVVNFFNASSNAATINSVIADNGSGAVALAKGGSGVLVLGAANSYTGTTTVNAGTLALAGGSAIANTGAVSLANTAGATLRLDSSEIIGSLSGGGASGGGVNLQANILTFGDSSSTTMAGPITGTGGALVKTGSGTVTLSGANTYTGGTTISAGTLQANATGALAGAVAVNSGTTLALNAAGGTFANTLSGPGTLSVTLGSGTTTTTLSGNLSGFTGLLSLSTGGKLNLSSTGANVISPSATIRVNSGGTLFQASAATSLANAVELYGGTTGEPIGQVRLEGGATLSGPVTLFANSTIGNNTAGNVGVISGIIGENGGNFGLTKVGAGTITLAGTNTYTGATTVSVGTLDLTGSSASSAVTLAASTTLSGEGSAASLTTSGVANLIINPGTSGAFTSTGAFTAGGVTTVSFAGTPPTSGTFRVLNYGSTTATTANFAIANSASYRSPTFTVNATSTDLTIGIANLKWKGTGGTNWDVNTTSNWEDATPAASKFYFGDNVTFDDSASVTTLAMSTLVAPTSVTFNNSTKDYTVTGATSTGITGPTGLTKNGSGSLTLGGVGSTFTGPVAINGGVFNFNNGEALGFNSGITIASGARLNFNTHAPANQGRNYTYTIAGDGGDGVGGVGAITTTGAADIVQNAGILNLNLSASAEVGGNNGRFDIGRSGNNFGTINGNGFTFSKVGSNSVVVRAPSSNITYVVNDGGMLSFEDFDSASGSNPITVNGTAKVGSYGLRTLPNNVTLNAGTTLISRGGGAGTWTGNIGAANTSTFQCDDTLVLAGTTTLAASGSLAKTGGSQLTITGTLTSTGGTLNQNGGTLQIGNLGTTGSFSGFTTVNVGAGLLFRSRLSGANNAISSNFVFSNATSELRQDAGLASDTLTLSGSVGNNTANGILRPTFGKIVLASGASSTVNMVAVQGTPVGGRAVLEVQTGATLTTPYFNIGQDSGKSGIVNVTGGAVTVTAGGTGIRIGHWDNSDALNGSQINVTGGSFDASATNLSTNVGWDGAASISVGGGASPATFKAWRLQLDANGDSATYSDTATLLTNGTLEVGAGGTLAASANDYVILNGGTIKGMADSTWAARMDLTPSVTSFAAVNSGVTVTQSGALTGTGTLNKNGSGVLILGGGTFPGTLTSSGGSLYLGITPWTVATVASSAGGVIQPGTPGASGTTTTAALTFNGGSPTFRGNYASGDKFVVTGTNGFTVASPTAITIVPGNDAIVGDQLTLIDYDGTIGGASGFGGLSLAATANPHFTFSLTNDVVNTAVILNVDALDSIVWKGNLNGTWDVNTTSNWQTVSNSATSKFYDFDAVKFTDEGSATPTVTLTGTIKPSSLEFDATADYTLQGSPITGNTGLVKSNTGKLTLLNNNTNIGLVNISGGTVQVGNGGTSGTLGGSGDITISLGSTLGYNRSDAVVLPGSRLIKGSGGMVYNGSGSLELQGQNPFSGGLTVNSGTAILSGGGWYVNPSQGTGMLTVNTGAVAVNWNAHSFGGGYDPNVDMTLNGGKFQVRSGTYVDDIWMTGGTIENYPASTSEIVARGYGGTVITVEDSAVQSVISTTYNTNEGASTITVNDPDTKFLLSGKITGNKVITKNGVGTMQWTGDNSGWTGGIEIEGGTLEVSSVADAGGAGSLAKYDGSVPGAGYLGIRNDATFRYTGTGAQSTTRNLWIDTGAQTKTLEVTSATGDITFSGTDGNINKPIRKTGAGALTINDVMNAGTVVTVDAGKLTLGGTNVYTGDTTVNATGTLVVDGDSIANAGKLLVNGSGKVQVTGTEVVDTLFIDGTQKPAGTYGATGSGATNIDDTHFSGSGVVSVTTGATTGYGTWASTNAPTGTSKDDYDGDGVSNGVEWVLGGLATTKDLSKLPTASVSGGNLIFTFVRNDAAWSSGDTTVKIEVGTSLASWPSVYTVGLDTASSSPGVTVTPNGSTDTITLTVPLAPDAKKFARLKVETTP